MENDSNCSYSTNSKSTSHHLTNDFVLFYYGINIRKTNFANLGADFAVATRKSALWRTKEWTC